MVQTYREALQCEAVRERCSPARRTPMVFGQPQRLGRAAGRGAAGRRAAATPALRRELRDRGVRAAPATRRQLDGAAVRVDRRRRLAARPGARGGDQRPLLLGAVRAPGEVEHRGAGRPARPGLVPAQLRVRQRRRGGGADADALSRLGAQRRRRAALARKTEWRERRRSSTVASGQRMLATDARRARRCSTCARSCCEPAPRRRRRTAAARRHDRSTCADRLQPALLDRLTDDDPGDTRRDRRRSASCRKRSCAQAVLRDLAWLFNARAAARAARRRADAARWPTASV